MKWLLVALNLVGFLTFPLYYGNQLLSNNPLLWILIPDCQLSALFFGLSLALILINKERRWLTQLGILMSFKYGLWTLLVLLPNVNHYVINTEFYLLVFSHIVLMLQPLIIIKKLSFKQSLPAFSFLLLNDVSDYLLNTHPYLPPNYKSVMMVVTPLITISLLLITFLKSNNPFTHS